MKKSALFNIDARVWADDSNIPGTVVSRKLLKYKADSEWVYVVQFRSPSGNEYPFWYLERNLSTRND